MKLTYDEAVHTVLETTEMGYYTLASSDRLWTVFIYDTWSDDEWFGNRLFFQSERMTSYDMWALELVWTTRAEAEAFAAIVRADYADGETPSLAGKVAPEVYVINWGDDARYEREVLEGKEFRARFKGSVAAVEAMRAMNIEWRKRHAGS